MIVTLLFGQYKADGKTTVSSDSGEYIQMYTVVRACGEAL